MALQAKHIRAYKFAHFLFRHAVDVDVLKGVLSFHWCRANWEPHLGHFNWRKSETGSPI